VSIYATESAGTESGADVPGDPNSYRPFKVVDSIIARNLDVELGKLDLVGEERALRGPASLTEGADSHVQCRSRSLEH
jgi:transcription initiation factor TFIIH subunit 3